MIPETVSLAAVAVLAFTSTVRSTLGFGDSLLAMPLLLLFIPLTTATPLVALVAVSISVLLLLKTWRNVRFNEIAVLVAASVAGIPIGIYGLAAVPEHIAIFILGFSISTYALFKMLRPDLLKLESNRLAPLFGLLSGVFGGAFNNNGPPIVVYSTLRGWESEAFVANLQGFFLTSGIFIVAGHGLAGLWTAPVTHTWIASLPVCALAVVTGRYLSKFIKPNAFDKTVYAVLGLAGLTLITKSLGFI